MHLDDIHHLLTDPTRPAAERLLRLQGWRDAELTCALRAGWAMRLGPGACAVLGAVALIVADPWLYVAGAVASAIGVTARNHPVELLWVWWARRHDRPVPPPNRAGRRFACALGALCFAVAGLGVALDSAPLLLVFGGLMVVVPGFVAATNLCLPSLLLTALVGAERVTRRHFATDARPGADRPTASPSAH